MESADLRRLAAVHGLEVPTDVPQPWAGATSRVYPLGDVVIKVAFDTPDAVRSLEIDAAMNPVARGLGVRTPELIAFDDSRDILPVPYAIFRRVPDARPLAMLSLDEPVASMSVSAAWEDAGRNLALVHAVPYGTALPVPLREFRQSPEVDPRGWVEELRARNLIQEDDARWLRGMLDTVAPAALADVPLHLCHGDVNASNILLSGTSESEVVLIDWAGAGWLDPVWDFAGVPLPVVPWLLAGHRSVAPLAHDETAGARILWCQAQTRLHAARSHENRDRLDADVAALRAFADAQGWS